VKIGPSLAKIPLDLLVFVSSLRRLMSTRYDVMDCHEEAGLMGVVLSRLFRVPTIYDMHSSLPEQLSNFRFSRSRILKSLLALYERLTIRGSRAIIVICPYLRDVVARVDPERPTFLIENSPLSESGEPASEEDVKKLRYTLSLGNSPVVLYTGTFEAYQGFELLFDAFQRAVMQEPHLRLLMVGGQPEQVLKTESFARGKGLQKEVIFTGQRPPSEMPGYLAAADVLVSPRSSGTNTPLKIYSYLQAGKPIVATRLLTHTQVLDDEVAMLTEPDPAAFAEGILTLVREPERARRLGEAASQRAEEKYSYQRYLDKTRRVFEFLTDSTKEEPLARSGASTKQ
jgi:glycosyltransferase involved in cell wall biosynthesis